jgi:hypothetical protein
MIYTTRLCSILVLEHISQTTSIRRYHNPTIPSLIPSSENRAISSSSCSARTLCGDLYFGARGLELGNHDDETFLPYWAAKGQRAVTTMSRKPLVEDPPLDLVIVIPRPLAKLINVPTRPQPFGL